MLDWRIDLNCAGNDLNTDSLSNDILAPVSIRGREGNLCAMRAEQVSLSGEVEIEKV